MANEKENLITLFSSPLIKKDSFIKSFGNKCLNDTDLLIDLASALPERDEDFTNACSRIFLFVAKKKPEFLLPLFHQVIYLLSHRKIEIRLRAAQAVNYMSQLSPSLLKDYIQTIYLAVKKEKESIIREHMVSSVVYYSGSGKQASFISFEILEYVLQTWKEDHAKTALKGIIQAVKTNPQLKKEGMSMAERFLFSKDEKVKEMAVKLLKKGR